jgi:hypothetical protein
MKQQPEDAVATTPQTPIVEDEELPDLGAPSSPTPIVETKEQAVPVVETKEQAMPVAPSTPPSPNEEQEVLSSPFEDHSMEIELEHTQTGSVHYNFHNLSPIIEEPSPQVSPPKSAGFFSRFIATPATKVARIFTGAKTQPVKKTVAAPSIQAPLTPNFTSHQQVISPSALLSPSLESLIPHIMPTTSTPPKNITHGEEEESAQSQRETPGSNLTTPATASVFRPRSILYGPDGEKIPTQYRNWIVRRIQQHQRDMETMMKLDAEVESGDRILDAREQKFKKDTLRHQVYLDMWRARQPGRKNKTTTQQIAGSKRSATEDPIEESLSTKRPRYEDSGSAGSAPPVRTPGKTFAVPEDSDDSDDDDLPPAKPGVGSTYGLPDDFYDYHSDSDSEDEPPSPPAPKPNPAFIHKYTPAKPSTLREVHTLTNSSPAIITPPPSPPGLSKLLEQLYDPQPLFEPHSTPDLDWTGLVDMAYELYAPVVLNRVV